MARMFQDAEKFLESLADDKLKNFSGHRGTIVQGDKFRIEYKGKNDYSPGYSHRLNLLPRSPGEPVRHGDKSSTISRNNISSHQLLATIHAADDATPDGVRKAFIMSIANGYTLAFAPPKPASTVTTVVKRIVHRKQR